MIYLTKSRHALLNEKGYRNLLSALHRVRKDSDPLNDMLK